jgi:acetylornithine deacetylase/succinyl-diaminopimelate desuccinylase-like protein
LHDQGVPHARCLVLIEACEESGSYDLPFYIDHLAPRIGAPSLIVCLDSGCGNYDQLWMTTSLRGIAAGTLTVSVIEEGVHSGDASGVVPSSFRILRQLLSRIEDETDGAIRPQALYAQVPAERLDQAKRAAAALGAEVYRKFPFVPGAQPMADDPTELVLNRTWRPQLAVTGIDGLPKPGDAGNVLLPYTTAKLSLRLPPTVDAEAAGTALKALLEKDPPYGARVAYEPQAASAGWNAPALAPWLEKSLARASEAAFGRPPAYMGEGGSIPFMAMLGERFPQAQFVVTGVLGPHSNAHGPNEFLHIPTGRRITRVIAHVLADHCARGEA